MPAINPFDKKPMELGAPAKDLKPATPSNTVDEDEVGVAFRAKTAGTVSFVTILGRTRSTDVVAGEIVPVGVRRINSTGTTALIELFIY